MLHRRTLMLGAAAVMSIQCSPARAASSETASPTIGAIRWDPWYDPADGTVAQAVEAALGPGKYHFRMPFFGKEISQNSVRINGYDQAIIDQEIRFASYAGLNYWSFVAYEPTNPLSNALHLYLKSDLRKDVNFCFIAELSSLKNKKIVDWHHRLMRERGYQRVWVRDIRPLYYILFSDVGVIERIGGYDHAKSLLSEFRRALINSGVGDPYIVALKQDPRIVCELAHSLGCDAIGGYGLNQNRREAPFEELVREAEQLWDEFAATGLPVVPAISVGFDRRPRVEHPVPWEAQSGVPGAGLNVFYETAKPDEIARELCDCLHWMEIHAAAVPAKTALIYAWNEFDEGGWLCPTYPDEHARIEAVRRVLLGSGR